MTMEILFFNTEAEAITAEARIRENCGIPPGDGTLRWSQIFAYDGGFYIHCPPVGGWRNFSKNTMLDGVVGEVRNIENIQIE